MLCIISYVNVFLVIRMFRSGYSVSLCCSVYCLCVAVYCTAVTGCQTKLQLTAISITTNKVVPAFY